MPRYGYLRESESYGEVLLPPESLPLISIGAKRYFEQAAAELLESKAREDGPANRADRNLPGKTLGTLASSAVAAANPAGPDVEIGSKLSQELDSLRSKMTVTLEVEKLESRTAFEVSTSSEKGSTLGKRKAWESDSPASSCSAGEEQEGQALSSSPRVFTRLLEKLRGSASEGAALESEGSKQSADAAPKEPSSQKPFSQILATLEAPVKEVPPTPSPNKAGSVPGDKQFLKAENQIQSVETPTLSDAQAATADALSKPAPKLLGRLKGRKESCEQQDASKLSNGAQQLEMHKEAAPTSAPPVKRPSDTPFAVMAAWLGEVKNQNPGGTDLTASRPRVNDSPFAVAANWLQSLKGTHAQDPSTAAPVATQKESDTGSLGTNAKEEREVPIGSKSANLSSKAQTPHHATAEKIVSPELSNLIQKPKPQEAPAPDFIAASSPLCEEADVNEVQPSDTPNPFKRLQSRLSQRLGKLTGSKQAENALVPVPEVAARQERFPSRLGMRLRSLKSQSITSIKAVQSAIESRPEIALALWSIPIVCPLIFSAVFRRSHRAIIKKGKPTYASDTIGEGPGGSDKAYMNVRYQTFKRFDLDGDDIICKEDMTKALRSMQLEPTGITEDECVNEYMVAFGADDGEHITFKAFNASFATVEQRLLKSGVDFEKASIITQAIMHELKIRGCLRPWRTVKSQKTPVSRRGVSLQVLQAISDGLSWISHDYNIPTFNYAMRRMCTGKDGELLTFTDLLSPKHVGSPDAYVAHMWTAPVGRWPGERPLVYSCVHVLKHFHAEEMTPAQLEKKFVWMDAFATSRHSTDNTNLAEVQAAVKIASRRDGTLFVLDPRGQALTRSWCLLEVWCTAETRKDGKLHILSPTLDCKAVQSALETLDIASASATLVTDQKRIMERFTSTGLQVWEINAQIKQALLTSAANGGRQAVDNADGYHGSQLAGRWATAATMLQNCAIECGAMAEPLFRDAVRACESHLGPDDPLTLLSVTGLGNLLMAKGNLQAAEKQYRRALEGQEARKGPDHELTLDAAIDLADLLKCKGDYQGAETLYRMAISGYENNHGVEFPATLSAVANLTILLKDKGDLSAAGVLCQDWLEKLSSSPGAENSVVMQLVGKLAAGNVALSCLKPYYAKALQVHDEQFGTSGAAQLAFNLAGIHKQDGNLEESEKLFCRAITGYETQLGHNNAHTLTAVYEYANVVFAKGDLKSAQLLYERALQGRESTLGPNHPDTLEVVSALAKVFGICGEIQAAEPLLRRCVDGYQVSLGPDHPRTLESVDNLAGLLRSQGDLDGAQPLYEKALETREAKLGSDHPDVLMLVHNLALLLRNKGDLEGAEPLFRRAVEGYEAKLGPDHPHTHTAVSNLANVFWAKGNLEVAELLYRMALKSQEQRFGPSHLNTLHSMNNLASLLRDKGDLHEAEILYSQVLAGYEAKLGPGHPHTLLAVHNVANLFWLKGDLDVAEIFYRMALSSQEDKMGAFHLNTLHFVSNLAALLRDKGELEEAEALFRRAVEGYKTKLGPNDSHTVSSAKSLASLLSQKEELAETAQSKLKGSPLANGHR